MLLTFSIVPIYSLYEKLSWIPSASFLEFSNSTGTWATSRLASLPYLPARPPPLT